MTTAAPAKSAAVELSEEAKGVEIFRAGTFTDSKGDEVTYSEADVQELADNTNKLLEGQHYEPPLKLGHDEKQKVASESGLPSLGWIAKVYREGSVLLADFKQIPDKLAAAVREGRYKYISPEIYHDEATKRNFGEFGVTGLSLRALALLGIEPPAIKGLKAFTLSEAPPEGADYDVVTLKVEGKMGRHFADTEDTKPLMVPANRHPFGALVKEKGKGDAPREISGVHKDGSYDTADHHDPYNSSKSSKAVPHENLTLLSAEEFHALKEQTMDPKSEEAVKLAEKTAADATATLLAERAERKKLEDKMRDDKIAAFAEKHKLYLTPAMRPSFEAVAKAGVEAPIKLSEGKEAQYLDAFLAFAEGLISAKKIQLGEVARSGGDGEAVGADVKLAEAPYKSYAEQNHVGISGAELALEARKYAEEKKVPYGKALVAVAALKKAEGEVA